MTPSRARSSREKRAAWLVIALVGVSGLSGCAAPGLDDFDRPGTSAFMDRSRSAATHPRNRLSATSCHDTTGTSRVMSAGERQAQMENLRLPQWRSGDVGVTAPLSDGRVLWVFGDTVRGGGTKPLVVSNSMLIDDGPCFAQVDTAGLGPVIADPSSSRACWPNSVTTLPVRGDDVVAVACSRIERGTDGLFDFSYRGMSLATFVVPHGGAPQPVTLTEVTPDSNDAEQINWGSAMVADGEWVYVYGSQQPRGSAGKGAFVARAHVADLPAHGDWQFWDGGRFQEEESRARPIVTAGEGVSQTYSVVRWKGRFVLVSKQGGEFGQNIGVWSAPRPEGPWRGERAVAEPYSQGGGVVAYQPLAHPELQTPDGRLLVTMSRTTERFEDLLTHPERGRPMFLAVDPG